MFPHTYSSKFFVVFVDFSVCNTNSGDLLIFNREIWKAIQKSWQSYVDYVVWKFSNILGFTDVIKICRLWFYSVSKCFNQSQDIIMLHINIEVTLNCSKKYKQLTWINTKYSCLSLIGVICIFVICADILAFGWG